MGRKSRRANKGSKSVESRNYEQNTVREQFENKRPRKELPPLEPKTEPQMNYMDSIINNDITFSTGPAGTGKTYVITMMACEALDKGLIDQIIISRPAVEADEDFGFLPGELDEKYAPYLEPFLEYFHLKFGKSKTDYLIKAKKIKAVPLGFMRGLTFKNAWVILDEAQNTTINQMKMFLTRIGYNAKMIINGDLKQTDLKGQTSGLEDAINRFDYQPEFGVIKFEREDCVRHGLTGRIISLYED
jgi:phosphate starvation-inducible PhoH-like protein